MPMLHGIKLNYLRKKISDWQIRSVESQLIVFMFRSATSLYLGSGLTEMTLTMTSSLRSVFEPRSNLNEIIIKEKKHTFGALILFFRLNDIF